jgi:ferric-dicitrate binding protein FerR (iron transport regulator)
LKTNTSEYILLPSNSIRKINGNSSQSSVTELLKPTWIDGESTFKSVPIKYVIKALEDQYNIKFDAASIDDTTIFSGSFPHNNLRVAYTTVFDALQIKYNKTKKGNIKLRY